MRDNLTRENGILTTKVGSRMEDRPSIRPGTTMRLQSRDRDSISILMGTAREEESSVKSPKTSEITGCMRKYNQGHNRHFFDSGKKSGADEETPKKSPKGKRCYIAESRGPSLTK